MMDQLKKQIARNLEKAAIHLQGRLKEVLNVTGNPYIASKGASVWYRNENPSAPGEAPRKMLGDLQRSIAYEMASDGQAAYVGTNLDYGKHLEFGTSKMAARPWLQVTMAREGDTIARIICEGLD